MPVTEWTQRGLQWGGVLLLWLAVSAHAQIPVSDPFVVRLVVSEDAPEDRAALFARGLDQVVRRLAGPDVRLTDAQAEAMVSRYGYQRDPQGRLLFEVVFSEETVEAALAQQGVALWKGPRPVTLLWLTVGPGAPAVTAGAPDPALAELSRQAEMLGLPLRVPPAGFRASPGEDPAQLAAGPLGAGVEAVLAVEATSLPDGRWSAVFRTFMEGQPVSAWTAAPATLDAMVSEGLQRHEALLRGRFAQASTALQASHPVRIVVGGIARYTDYARVAAELQSQQALKALFLEEAGPAGFVWRANTTLPSESLRGALEANERMRSRPAAGVADPDRLELEWVAAP
ncbi:MAG: DUF2066 domain-containing protein [Candidatus Macondimonas sp.]